MTTETERDYRRGGGLLTLWVGLGAAPLAYALKQQLTYMLVPWACRSGNTFVLHSVTAATLLLALAGGIVAWRDWRRLGEEVTDEAAGGTLPRSYFMATLGLLLSGLLFLGILWSGVASFIIGPCQW